MTGWLILAVLAAALGIGLVVTVRPTRDQAMLIGAAILVAFAGYAWQGRPGLPGKPTRPQDVRPPGDTLFARERRDLLETVGPDPQVLDAADQLIRGGDTDYAIATLRAALTRRPGSMLLWLGLGNALVAHSGGFVTPPARYAFDRAASLGRGHPAPSYFLGLAYAEAGELAAADVLWTAGLQSTTLDPRWRERLTARLFLLRRLEAESSARN